MKNANWRTEADCESRGYFVIPGAPIVGRNSHGMALYASDWVSVEEDIPF